MRDFDLLRAPRRRSEVNEQTRTSTIYGGTENGDFTRGGSARRDGERGMPAAWLSPSVFVSLAGGGPGRIGGGVEARCAATPRKDDPEARHKAEMERMRAVIAEITAENLELKKKI